MKLLLGCLALLLQDGTPADWWNADWKHRRKIRIKNNLEGALEAGYPLAVLLDAKYLELPEKAKKGLTDLAVVHQGKELPFALFDGPSKGTFLLWFRTVAPLAAEGKDSGYAIYYGNPAAPARGKSLAAVLDYHEDFENPDRARKGIAPDGDVTWSIRDGALVIREVSAGRTRLAPAKILLKTLPPTPGFALEFDLKIEAPKGAVLDCAINVELKKPKREDRSMEKRIVALIAELGNADFEAREKATGELLEIAEPAVPQLVLATRSDDPEVKWRAEHLLKRIEENSAPLRISAGVRIGGVAVNPVSAWASIRGNPSRMVLPDERPLAVRISVLRDQDGDVTLLWNNGKPQMGTLPGEIERIYFSIHKGVSGPMGTIRIDNISVRRYVDDESRPTYTIDVEESRPERPGPE